MKYGMYYSLKTAVILLIICLAESAYGQSMLTRDADGGTTVRATRIQEPLELDGRLDESWYKTIPPLDDFIQQEPREGEPATEKTEAWIFFDDENIYFAARNWDSQPERMVMNEMRHDSANLIQNEHMSIIIDTFHDRRNGVIFLVNALGGMLEESFVDERNPNRDWNTVWDVKAARFENGWIFEAAIPFKSLRYRPGTGQTWGVNLNRIIRWKNERTYLAPLPASFGIHRVSVAATLVGLETPPPAKNLEIKPYAIAGTTTALTANPIIRNDGDADAGLDLKYGLTRGLTADFTLNTDFAQVEEDEQQVNLTRFSLFFPEKREFFLEGQGIFNFGGRAVTGAGNDTPILFFSRQIGLSRGREVPIIAGSRLTGRAGAYTLGLLNIQTDDNVDANARATNFTTLRVRRDVLRRSNVGALFTRRSVSTKAEGSNEAYGIDGLFSLYQNVRINTYIARTRTNGLTGDDLSYRGEFDYNADRYGLQVEHLAVGEHFNPEVGFLRREDFRKSAINLRFSPRPRASRLVRKLYYTGGLTYITNGEGQLESRLATAGFRTDFQNGDQFSTDYNGNYELLEQPFPIATGVVVPSGGYSFNSIQSSYTFGPQQKLPGTVSISAGSFYTGHQTAASYRGRVNLIRRLTVEPAVSVNWVDLDEGRFTTKLVSTRATVPLTPRSFISALIQYNSSVNAFSSSIRFRWEYQPGSELFVVYSEGRNTSSIGFPQLESRGFIVKINRLFRL
jgi:hypothetical protein